MLRKSKQYIKNNKNVVLIVATSLLLLGMLIFMQVAKYVPQPGQTPTTTLPTKQIDKKHSIGGEVALNNKRQNSKSGANQHATEALNNATNFDPSPKQTEIKKTIAKEYAYTAFAMPNDPYAQSGWSLSAMNAPSAWNAVTGNGVTVAVIDTGFALNHEDLTNQWFTNSGETGQTQAGDRCWTGNSQNKSTNSCDDDNNGYVDDYRGWDFVNHDSSPMAGVTNPNGQGVAHGTETAGLVGASGNNSIGTATLSWNTTIMPLQVLSDNGSGYTSDVVAAIYYAVDMGAKVINMSLGGYSLDPALQPAIDYAYSHGVVVVAAAGNCGTGQEAGCDPNKPGAMGYPALNSHVISVGATTSSNARASFSSYGPALDVVAPGSGTIISTLWQPGNQTSSYSGTLYGTSFASPYVASLAALVKSVRPSTSVDDITGLIDGTASKVSGMNGAFYSQQYGHGLIDANTILNVAQSLNANSPTPELSQSGGVNSEHMFTASSNLGSGCKSQTSTYCTIHIFDNYTGFERYLPYSLTGGNGQTGWNWKGDTLASGNWQIRAVQGQSVSATPYSLFQK